MAPEIVSDDDSMEVAKILRKTMNLIFFESSPETLKEDIEAIYKFMRKEMGMKGKMGGYGRSLGGIPSSHISTKVDMAIIDRSFCNISAMAYWKYRGHFADLLFKVGTCGW